MSQVDPKLLELTTEITVAYLSNNECAPQDIPGLIEGTYASLSGKGKAHAEQEPAPEPAVPIRKSVTPDYIVCLEDGKKLKMLKRYLRVKYDMAPDDYRQKWNLSPDYPMTAPNYSKHRSRLAKDLGFGTREQSREKS